MTNANQDHMKAMLRIMKYCSDYPDRGRVLKSTRKWNSKDKIFRFIISTKLDSKYSSCNETRRSVAGFIVYLEGAIVSDKSGMQKIVALSVAEAEVIALIMCVQETMYIKKLIESIELMIMFPMLVQVDNKAAVDLANAWTVGSNMKHSEVKLMYLRE